MSFYCLKQSKQIISF